MRNRKGRVRALLLAALVTLGLTINAGTPVLAGDHVSNHARWTNNGPGMGTDDMGHMPWPI